MKALPLLFALLACRSDPGGAEPAPEPSAAPAPGASAEAVRRTYFVAHEERRCVVFWMEGDRHSESKDVPCPRELTAGERARLAGKTCQRESPEALRNVPIRCPRELLDADQHDRVGKGRWRLQPAR
jgi:hypothetical protein